MVGTIERWLKGVSAEKDRRALRAILRAVGDRLSSVAMSSAGLVIKGASDTLAKTGTALFHATANGKAVTIAASTDMPALTGLVITANSFNVACFFSDAAGTVTVLFGTEGTTRARMVFPNFKENEALVGYLIITHTSTFTGGTTNLDAAGVTTDFVSPIGAVDPSVLTK